MQKAMLPPDLPPRLTGADALARKFFPTPPEADLSDIEGYEYPEPVPMPEITVDEVRKAVRYAVTNKQPGDDEIPNEVLQWTLKATVEHLQKIYNASLTLSHYPTALRKSITVALRNPGKKDYSNPKAYRPIALLNTTGKVMESIIATRISWAVEEFGLLPRSHLGGRRGTSTEHAIQDLVEPIDSAWKGGKVCTTQLYEIFGAFDNIAHVRLTHNMRKRGMGGLIAA